MKQAGNWVPQLVRSRMVKLGKNQKWGEVVKNLSCRWLDQTLE